jgi:hypothetical protein
MFIGAFYPLARAPRNESGGETLPAASIFRMDEINQRYFGAASTNRLV